MIVAIDANVLILWSAAVDRTTAAVIRLENLLDVVSRASGSIVIPMPSFAEFLVRTDDATTQWMEALERKKAVVLAPLDKRAAYECSLIDRRAIQAGNKKAGLKEHWQKIKIDRQVVAIARANGATRLISDDASVRATGLLAGLEAFRLDELALPQAARQMSLLPSSLGKRRMRFELKASEQDEPADGTEDGSAGRNS